MKISTKTITRVAIFGSLSGLLYCFLKFPLPFFLSFYEINFSDVPALIGGFSFGPLAGVLIQVIKIVIKLVFVGSNTAFVGEFSDLILGIVMVLPASLYYKYHRNIKGAIIGSIISAVTNVIIGAFTNYFILLPFYGQLFFKNGISDLINMIIAFYPSLNINESNALIMCILVCTIPFNLLKNTIIVCITFILYKRLGYFIKYIEKKTNIENSYVESNPFSILRIISILIAIFSFIGSVLKFINKDFVFGFIFIGVTLIFGFLAYLFNYYEKKNKKINEEENINNG